MKGLILKDFYSLKIYIKTLAIMVVIYTLLSAFSGSQSMLSGLIAIFCMILPITSFSYDKYYKWEEYALSLPLRRAQIVLAKYIFTLSIIIISMAVTMALSAVIEFFSGRPLTVEYLKQTCMTNYFSMGIFLLIPAILLPVLFKFGPDKGRIALFVVLGVFSLVTVAIAQFAPKMVEQIVQLLSDERAALFVFNTIPVVTLLLFFLSYFLSCAFYQKREI